VLLEVKNLRTEEAALTGESVPIDKTIDAVSEKATVGDREGMAFSGTLVASGRGTGVVVATGANTELGRINQMMAARKRARDPAASSDQEVRIRDHRDHLRGKRNRVRLRQVDAGDAFRGYLPGRRVHRGVRHSGRFARAYHRHAGDRRPAHGPTKCHHPAPSCGRDPWFGVADLLRQDRHAHAHGDDGRLRRDGAIGLQRHWSRLCRRGQSLERWEARGRGSGAQAHGPIAPQSVHATLTVALRVQSSSWLTAGTQAAVGVLPAAQASAANQHRIGLADAVLALKGRLRMSENAHF
jgi:E1-E2 ATPase